ncbi:MAG TPA: FAD-dependent oxidoreductase [Spirochaetia bacterium]
MEADVVVVAAGASGITAAVAAAEKDASVIVFEKGSTTGGAASMGMGFFAVESKHQKAQMVDLTIEEAFRVFMEYNHWQVDARLVRKYFAQSASTVEWIEGMGVEFLGAYKYFEKSYPTWHIVKAPGANRPSERAASNIYKALTDRAGELGVKIRFQTAVKKILTDPKTRRVVGVLAQDATGNEITCECDALIVCTGGFGDNPPMIKEHLGFEWGKDLFSFRIPGLVGDGLKMMWEIGGGRTPVNMEMTYNSPGVTDIFKTLSETMRQPNLLVNLDGKRFMNEVVMQNTTFTGNAIAHQRDRKAFSIITDEILDDYRKKGLDFITVHHNIKTVEKWDSELQTYLSGGTAEASGLSDLHAGEQAEKILFVADTVEDLCRQTGIDAKGLAATIEQYNVGAGGRDGEFDKHPRYMRAIRGKRFYAAAHRPCGYGTLGGIKTNDNLQVLTEDGRVIPGLYSAGTDACNIFSDSYCFIMPGNTMGWAINSGRMAGYNAVAYIDSDEFVE